MTIRSLPFLFAVAALLGVSPADVHAQKAEECLACHGEKGFTMSRGGKDVSISVDPSELARSPHAKLDCIACHKGFKADAIPHAARIRPVNCLSCHSGPRFEHFAESVHAQAKPSVTCAACHGAHTVRRVTDKDPAERHEFATQVCARCHGDVSKHYLASDHGKALVAGVKGAPNCIDCHGEHDVVSPTDSAARTSRLHSAAMCLKCHVDNPDVRARVGPSAGFIESYEQSVHGRAQQSGNGAAATCIDCHGSHDMMKGSDPSSHVAKGHIAGTCAQCHADVAKQYQNSVHGKAVAKGVAASATCTDCHGEHGILSPKDPRSPVAPANVSAQVCTPCHASVSLTRKYGLRSDRFQTFADSYHGLATRAGRVEVANCASCHGVHDIKPSSDPTSRIAPANLAATCGSCHPGASENFTRGSVHVIATAGSRDDILSIIATIYIVLIIVVVGGMLAHNLLDFVRRARNKLQRRRGELPTHPAPARNYLRMTVSERVQHATFAISFTILVVTGFALRFPEAWWVAPIRQAAPWTINLRGLLHRLAGVAMVAASLYHLGYLAGTVRGRQLVRDLLPTRKDFSDAIGLIRYNLGLGSERPRFGRFTYAEKLEYLALVWGTALMAVTGVILWFDNTFLNLLTKLGWDIARTVHYYEAWLALLSILVWHFYFVIFNPDVYPVNLTAFTGTMTEEEMEDEHPLELEAIKRREATGQEAPNP